MSADMQNNNKLTINNFDRLLGETIYLNYIIDKVEVNDGVYKMEGTYYHTIDLPPHKIHIHINRRLKIISRTIGNSIISTNIYWMRMGGSAISDTIYVSLGKMRGMEGWLEYMGEEVRKLVGM